MSRNIAYGCHDSLKHKLLEHEAIFKNQVYELHRIYGIQRHMMEEIRRREVHKHPVLIEPSYSSSLQGSQQTIKEATKCDISLFPFPNSGYPRPSKSSANLVSSPLRSSKGNIALTGLHNASASMDCEVLEVRPSKVRKKQFDLQLPAEEYIGTEEEPFHNSNIANKSSSLPKGNSRISSEKPDKLLLNGCAGEKIDCQRATSISESCLRNSMRLTDLNEPVEVEDGAVLSSADYLLSSANKQETKGLSLPAKSSPGFFGFPKQIKQNALHVSQSESPDYASVGNEGYGTYCLSGLEKNNLISIPQGFQHFQLPLCSNQQVGHRSPAIFSTDYGGTHLRRDRTDRCLEALDKIHDGSSYNRLDSVMTMKMQPHNAFTPELSTCPRSENFWRSPGTLNLPANPSKSSHSSTQSCDILGEKWQSNWKSRLNPGLDGLSLMSDFCHGSFSGSKEMLARHTTGGFSVLDRDGSDNTICAPSMNHGLEVVPKGTNPKKVVDLNVSHSKGSPIDADFLRDVEIITNRRACKSHLTVLPWLTAKPATGSGVVDTRRESNSEEFSAGKVFSANVSKKDISSKLQERENYTKKPKEDSNGIKKVLGFPIFHHLPNSRDLSPVSTLVSVHHSHPGVEDETERHRIIDINLACEEEVASEILVMEKEIDKKIARSRNHIDLNTCISEEEESLAISVATKTSCVQVVVDRDLGAPVLETEDDILPGELQQHEGGSVKSTSKDEQTQEEVARKAAEAIVLLSYFITQRVEEENVWHPSEDSLAGSLLWFADEVCTLAKETKDSKEEKDSDDLTMMSDGMDDFEVMTLQLQETKEEDYMPHPFVLEVQKIEEIDTNLTSTRRQKGNTRKGRQRKEFLRDILSGLASLSRLEVTEDLQNFEGLMKATGHTWSPGLPRRNRSGRGRRRRVDNLSTAVETANCTILMDQPTNIEAFLGNYSLKGWGKKTRRPHRQGRPAGNPLA